MTTSVRVTSHNYPVLVRTLDRKYDPEKNQVNDEFELVDEKIFGPEDGPKDLYVTTTRKLEIYDLDQDNERVKK